MNDLMFNLLIGLGIGSLYACLGAGLVISFKGSGVINFAHGALAMYGVFTFDRAWSGGEFFLPLVDFLPTSTVNVPVRITLSSTGRWPMIPSLILALLMAAALGLAAHFLVFRPLRNAAPLGKVIASLGLALYLQGVALVNFGTSFPQAKSIVPTEAVENFLGLGKTFPRNTIYVVGFAILLGFVIWAGYRFTRFGLATRAAAGNEKGAVLLGYSPQTLAAVNWVIASVTATLAVIIVGPIQGTITPVGLTALIVPALAAALIGGLRSVPIAVMGGLGLGAVQTLLDIKRSDWFTGPALGWLQSGVRNTLPLVVIVVVLFVRGKSLPSRGSVVERRLPLAPQPKRIFEHAFIWLTLLVLLAFVFENSGARTKFANSFQNGIVLSIIMLSIVVITGYTGQISLAQMTFAGIAAFFTARMMADGIGRGANLVPVTGFGLPWPIAGLIGVIMAVIVGVIIGIPAVRIRGVQLAVVTIAAAIAMQSVYFENDYITQLRAGVPAYIKTPTFFGIDIGARSARAQNENPNFVIFGGIVLALCAIAVANIRRGGVGRRFLAIRANERAAAAGGINVMRTKLLAFAVSSGLAGIGGVMLGFKQVEVSSANFNYGFGLSVLAFAYLAGITSINGALIAGMLLSAGALVPTLSNYMFAGTNIDKYITLIGGLAIIVTAIANPSGVAIFFGESFRHAGNWLVGAIPGLQTIRDAFRGPKSFVVRLVLIVGWVGLAVWLRQAQFVDNVYLWILVSVIGFLILAMIFARSLDKLVPSFAEAGAQWNGWFKQFGVTAIAGYAAGWVIWPIRVDSYSKLWMPIVGAVLALFVRSIVRPILSNRASKTQRSDTDLDVANIRTEVG